MKAAELLAARRANWRELDRLCALVDRRRCCLAETIRRFSALYRAACADLALADAYRLPPAVTRYLDQLVARAHNQLYRNRAMNVDCWFQELFIHVPRRLFNDNSVRLAFAVFWGLFALSALRAANEPDYADRTLGGEMIAQLDRDFSQPPTHGTAEQNALRAGFYVFHNGGIGLRCFAFGIVFGVGGLFVTAYNATVLGAVFGYMYRAGGSENFYQFVTAHGPMELTAIVLMAAAGMKLGFSLIDTRGLSRRASLAQATRLVLPTVCMAILMFLVAAAIEGFISLSPIPYAFKAAVGATSTALLLFYFVLLGYPRPEVEDARGT